jgi:hypothetical protein
MRTLSLILQAINSFSINKGGKRHEKNPVYGLDVVDFTFFACRMRHDSGDQKFS